MIEIGLRLKALRDGIKISQVKMGELVGLKQSSINRYEKGQAEAPYRVLLWYADYFDVSMDYIFGRCDKPQGKLYEYNPKYIDEKVESNEDLKQFIEMCFDPNSSMNEKLKETLAKMLEEGKK